MTSITRKVIQDTWINIMNYGIHQTGNDSTKRPFSSARKFFGAVNNGLMEFKNIFVEYMEEIFAWTCVILTGMIILFYVIGIAKAAFFKSADRRKEVIRVLFALPLLLWCFVEFFLVLFRILPDNEEGAQNGISNPSRFVRGVKKTISSRSLSVRWGKLKQAQQDEEDMYYEHS